MHLLQSFSSQIQRSILTLSGSFSFLFTLYAGLFVMFTLSCISKDTRTSAFTLPTLDCTLQGFVFTNADFHYQFPPSLMRDIADSRIYIRRNDVIRCVHL